VDSEDVQGTPAIFYFAGIYFSSAWIGWMAAFAGHDNEEHLSRKEGAGCPAPLSVAGIFVSS
jgi:hypothetical protein